MQAKAAPWTVGADISTTGDLLAGLKMYRMWMRWAWLDIRQGYRRSILGNLWITLNLAVLIGGMGLVFGALFNQDTATYLPYVGVSMVIWGIVSALLNEGCLVFIGSSGKIVQNSLPLSTYVFRHVATKFLHLLHTFIVVVVLVAVTPTPVGIATLLFVPGLFIIYYNGFWIAIILGVLSLRFRDLPMLVQNIVQVTFFITPIFWRADTLGSRAIIADANPLFHFLEVVRQPLLGELPTTTNYLVVAAISFVVTALGVMIWRAKMRRIAFWL